MSSLPAPAALFAENGFAVVRSVVSDPLLGIAYGYALKMLTTDQMNDSDKRVPGPLSLYGDPLMDSLLDCVLPHLEQVLGIQLHQTNSHLHLYQRGDKLNRHVVQDASKIAMTLTIGFDANEISPIFVESRGKSHKLLLEPGDTLIYRSHEHPHWREVFQGNHQVQVSMFPIDQQSSLPGANLDVLGLEN